MHWFTIYNILKVTHIFRRLFGSIQCMLAKTLFKIWQNHINKNNVIIIVEWTSSIYFRIKQIKENMTMFLYFCKIVRISSYSRLLAFSVKCFMKIWFWYVIILTMVNIRNIGRGYLIMSNVILFLTNWLLELL